MIKQIESVSYVFQLRVKKITKTKILTLYTTEKMKTYI